MTLTHLDNKGNVQMVDVSNKAVTAREAKAEGFISMQPETLAMIIEGTHKKGDVLATARIAGIQAAKKTWELIPMCHPLMLTSIKVDIIPISNTVLKIEASCKVNERTGVEMEALTTVSISALTIYDMCKAVDKTMAIFDIQVLEKKGGKSGHWQSKAS
jgi:cyclic pyranopterin phosphate synthase